MKNKPVDEKICCTCEKSLPATKEFFHVRNTSPDGLRCDCKKCRKEGNRRDYSAPFKKCTVCKKVKPNNPDFFHSRKKGVIAKTRAMCKECHYIKIEEWRIKSRYGISKEELINMESEQGGKCAICNEIPKRLVIDHCHETGKVRNLLCDNCNTGIGMLRESQYILENAIKYLNRHKNQETTN